MLYSKTDQGLSAKAMPMDYLEALKTLVSAEEERQRIASENARLKIALDDSREWFTVKRVANMNGIQWKTLDWNRLKSMSIQCGLGIQKVFDANYSEVNAYHHSVWETLYPDLKYE